MPNIKKRMKKFIILLPVFCCLMALFACKNTRTYADMKEDEKNTILEFITANDINVISMNQFLSDQTGLTANEIRKGLKPTEKVKKLPWWKL